MPSHSLRAPQSMPRAPPVHRQKVADLLREAMGTSIPYDIVPFVESYVTSNEDIQAAENYLNPTQELLLLPSYQRVLQRHYPKSLQARDTHPSKQPFVEEEPEFDSDSDSCINATRMRRRVLQARSELSEKAREIRVPYDIREFIEGGMDSASGMPPGEYELVRKVLKAARRVTRLPNYVKMKSIQHCVRCHRNYTTNGSEDCTIAHVFDYSDPKEDRIRREGTLKIVKYYEALCCEDVILIEDGPKNFINIGDIGFCVAQSHTTSKSEVKKSHEASYNGYNIKQCERDPKGGVGLLGLRCKILAREEDPILLTRTSRRRKFKAFQSLH